MTPRPRSVIVVRGGDRRGHRRGMRASGAQRATDARRAGGDRRIVAGASRTARSVPRSRGRRQACRVNRRSRSSPKTRPAGAPASTCATTAASEWSVKTGPGSPIRSRDLADLMGNRISSAADLLSGELVVEGCAHRYTGGRAVPSRPAGPQGGRRLALARKSVCRHAGVRGADRRKPAAHELGLEDFQQQDLSARQACEWGDALVYGARPWGVARQVHLSHSAQVVQAARLRPGHQKRFARV